MTRTGIQLPLAEGESLWSSVLHGLPPRAQRRRDELGAHTRCVGITPTSLRVRVDASHLRDWIDDGVLTALVSGVESLSDGGRDLALLPATHAVNGHDPTQSFDAFVTSPANQKARAVAAEFVDATGDDTLLLLSGPAGSGKSHLLRAISLELSQRRSPAPSDIRVCGAEELSLELINAIWNGELDAFRARLTGAGALLVDDVQLLAGREATQDELAATVDALAGAGVPVAVATSRAPDRLQTLVEPLRQKLAAGRRVELSPPEWETRVAILLDRLRRWDVQVAPEVSWFLASKLRTGLERLDALLTRLVAHPSCRSGLTDVDVVRHVVADGTRRALRVAPEDVMTQVARHFNLRLRDLRSSSRSPRVTTPRQIAMYLLRRHCGLSYPEIGRRFDRHHTTALHSDRLVQRQLDQNGGLRAAVVLLEKELLRTTDDAES